jgi:hypothetical protein
MTVPCVVRRVLRRGVEQLQHLVPGGEHDLSWLREEEGQQFFLHETWTLKVILTDVIEQHRLAKNGKSIDKGDL